MAPPSRAWSGALSEPLCAGSVSPREERGLYQRCIASCGNGAAAVLPHFANATSVEVERSIGGLGPKAQPLATPPMMSPRSTASAASSSRSCAGSASSAAASSAQTAGSCRKSGCASPAPSAQIEGATKTSKVAVATVLDILRADRRVLSSFNSALLCLVYTGVNISCFFVNAMDEEFRAEHELSFHLLEFWATFLFSVVQVYIALCSFTDGCNLMPSTWTLNVVMVCSVVFSFVPAMLVTLSLKRFEILSHETEYTNELTMCIIDLTMLGSLTRGSQDGPATWSQSAASTLFAFFVAAVQLVVYNFRANGEQEAHFLEFLFEIVSSLISFSFCMQCCAASASRARCGLLELKETEWGSEAGAAVAAIAADAV